MLFPSFLSNAGSGPPTSSYFAPSNYPASYPSAWVDWLLLPASVLVRRPGTASDLTCLVQATDMKDLAVDLQFEQLPVAACPTRCGRYDGQQVCARARVCSQTALGSPSRPYCSIQLWLQVPSIRAVDWAVDCGSLNQYGCSTAYPHMKR